MYEKIVNKGNPQYCYLQIRLDFEKETEIPVLEPVTFKRILLEAVSTLFGLQGSSSQIDVLKYDRDSRIAIVKIKHNFLSRFWSSLTLFGSYKGDCCAFRVLQVSPHLMALACNSRAMVIQAVEK